MPRKKKIFLLSDGREKYTCRCGCGQEIKIIEAHKRYGVPNYIRGHFDKEKQKQAVIKVIKTRKKLSPYTKAVMGNKISLSMKGHVVSETTRKRIGEANCGANHGKWKGGVSYLPYCSKFNNNLKERIRKKYGRCCYICGKPEKENVLSNGVKNRLSIHHIDGDKEQGCGGKEWKLVPLCASCHSKEHAKKRLTLPQTKLSLTQQTLIMFSQYC